MIGLEDIIGHSLRDNVLFIECLVIGPWIVSSLLMVVYSWNHLERHSIAREVNVITPWQERREMKLTLQSIALDEEPDTAVVGEKNELDLQST